MSTLNLHIGHGKTGSSFLQSIFSMNRKFMEDEGNIWYPVDILDESAKGKISSGNGGLLIKALRQESLPDLAPPDPGQSTLLSSEYLYHETSWLDQNALFDGSVFDKVRILLFIRDPFEILSSSYQQVVKRGGYFGTFDEYAINFRYFRKLEEMILGIREMPTAELTIANYSTKRPVDEVTAEWLGLPTFPQKPEHTINRSLSYSELFFQREFNKYFGKAGKIISDGLCMHLPNIKAYHVVPSDHAKEQFLRREEPFIRRINELISKTEQLVLDPKKLPSQEAQDISLNADQIRVICQNLGQNMKADL